MRHVPSRGFILLEYYPMSAPPLDALLDQLADGLRAPPDQATCDRLHQLLEPLQWEAVEAILAQDKGAQPLCPICHEPLPGGDSVLGTGPAALVQHIAQCWEALGTFYSTSGKPFAVASSMIGTPRKSTTGTPLPALFNRGSAPRTGTYFNSGECDRMLHLACERSARANRTRADDVTKMTNTFLSAHSARGDNYEHQVCSRTTCRPRVPCAWLQLC